MNEEDFINYLTEQISRECEEIEFDDESSVDYDMDYTVQE
jgi:hypothetical protein|tara:strand:+ start:449 stop:568 length:120 start_codon:yes stop_codon:yes gene_type:complete